MRTRIVTRLGHAAAFALALAALLAASSPASAGPTRYEPRRAGHPLRIVAYALHPVGVILDTLIFHPAWWVGKHEPLRTLFGVQVASEDEIVPVEPAPPLTPELEPEPEAQPEQD